MTRSRRPIDERPHTRDPDLGSIDVTPNSMLRAAQETPGISGARAGNRMDAPPSPTATFEAAGTAAYPYLKDLLPHPGDKRGLALQTDASRAAGVACMASYDRATGAENIGTAVGYPDWTRYRQHALIARWGTANGQAEMEWDVAEGNVANVPGNHLYIGLLNYSWSRRYPTTTEQPLISMVASSFLPQSSRSTFTTRVYAPYQVDVDPLAPPTIQTYLALLDEALIGRVFP